MFALPPIVKEYRPELNGLRGLAVLLVLLFHLEFYWMEGGFLGVDIFLVISGYFISRNILYERQHAKFTFKHFYTKRLRRLFPALIFTLAVALIAGYFLLSPANYERLGESTFFAALSVSNFFFWQESGYFDLDAIGKPLLHMWSLSLEEQFYLFWPLLLVVFHRWLRKYLFWIIAGMVLISILLAESYYQSDPSATFFLIPFRMFEFLLGAACIWLERWALFKNNYLKELLFTAGLFLMVFACVRLSSFTVMPGFRSLIPCGGAMMVIIGGKAVYSSWILKNGAMELIGKASYSIYLIHWPMIVYFKYWDLTAFTLADQLVIFMLSIIIGIGMYYGIENVFRYPRRTYRRLDPVWGFVPGGLLVICLLATNISDSRGMADRYTGSLFMSQEEIIENRNNYFKEYWRDKGFLQGDPTRGHILTLGNSHSVDLLYALRQNGFEGKVTALQSTGKCYTMGFSWAEGAREHCGERLQENLANANWSRVDAVYLHDNWPYFAVDDFREMIRVVRQKTAAPIFVFGPKMVYAKPVPDIVGASRSMDPDKINRFAYKHRLPEKAGINEELKEEFEDPWYRESNIHYIPVLDIARNEGANKYWVVNPADTTFLYFDAGHFTKKGSKLFGEKLKEAHPYFFDIELLKKRFGNSSGSRK